MNKRLLVLSITTALVVAGGTAWLVGETRGAAPRFKLAAVERGPLTVTVSASGSLNAVTLVQVGTQVSGQIREILVDFNTTVRRGQVIARIDPEAFEARVSQARAELEAARAAVANQEARVERARADADSARASIVEGQAQVLKAEVALADAWRDLERKTELFRRGLIARSDMEGAQTTHDAAREQALTAGLQGAIAQSRVGDAAVLTARAHVRQRQAAVQQAEVDLARTTIRAPVDGVVVARAVDVGQTVAASLQAPVLFTIAQDLTRMQVETSVDEADIARIAVGGRATFTVDAVPDHRFAGRVVQMRKAAQVVQNVVTYTVAVAADNPDGTLLPGMTANVRFVVAERADVLKVANAALRFAPPGVAVTGASKARNGRGHVWVLGPDGQPQEKKVTPGPSDGSATEILAGELSEGQRVIVGLAGGSSRGDDASDRKAWRFRL